MKKAILAASAALLIASPTLSFAQEEHQHEGPGDHAAPAEHEHAHPAGQPGGQPHGGPPGMAQPHGAPQGPPQGPQFHGGRAPEGPQAPQFNGEREHGREGALGPQGGRQPQAPQGQPFIHGGQPNQGEFRPDQGFHGERNLGDRGQGDRGQGDRGQGDHGQFGRDHGQFGRDQGQFGRDQGDHEHRFAQGWHGPLPGARAFNFGGHQYYRYHAQPYRYPHGYYGWSHHSWRRGDRLPWAFIISSYLINDWYDFGLWEPDYGAEWVRVGADAVLVDRATGEIIDVVPGVYYY